MSQKPYYPPPPQPPPQQQQQQFYPPPPNASTYYSEYGQQNRPPTYDYNYNEYNAGHQTHSSVAEKWNSRPQFQDLWAALLFLIQFVGFIALSYVGIKDILDRKNNPISSIELNTNGIVLLVITGIFGFVLSLTYMFLMQRFPKPLIRITLYLAIATYFIAAVVFGLLGQIGTAIFFAIFGVIYLICAFTWRDRIPFAAVMLETVTALTKRYYGTVIMAFVGLLFQVGWSVWWALTTFGAFNKFYESSGCSSTSNSRGRRGLSCEKPHLYLVLLFLVFSFYWTSQVIKNIVHVTDSGVYAAFYFLEGSPRGVGSNPTLGSLRRACTTSFGSICFGSLIIAILNTIKAIFRSLAESNDDACGGFVAACFACLLSWIESLVEYFNHYAYVQVAIYGKSYCQAAKDTWRLIKDRGVEAIINDDLIGNVLAMGAIFIGALCALFGYAYLLIFMANEKDNGSIVVFIIVCFFLGFMMTAVVTDAIYSGVGTTFVALAEDPDALRRTKPELFERIRRTWPQVVQGM